MYSDAPRELTRLGEYQLGRRVATGAMSEIYEARRIGAHGFSRRVALKRILPQLASDLHFVRMFSDEARVHAGLDHPNLVQVLDFGEERGELFMVMEYVDGIPLSELMALNPRQRRTRIELAPALYIARAVLVGLAHVHAALDAHGAPLGLVHRDVAPSNILLSRTGEVKLTDFGIVRSAALESRTMPGELKGKLGYVSPEQAMGARVDARSDLFSVGAVLAEMLMGEPLFGGRTELEMLTSLHSGDLTAWLRHANEVPGGVHDLLMRLLAQRPVERVASARQAADEIDRVTLAHGFGMNRAGLAEYVRGQGFLLVDNPSSGRLPRATPIASQEPSESLITYRVRRPGGTIVGPLPLARVIEMVATARAGLDSEVSCNGGAFLPVASMAELAGLAGRPAYRFFDPVALMATERHALSPSVTPWHFFRALREKRTGLLCVRSGRVQRRFYLVEGRLTSSASSEPDELFGAVLSRLGFTSAPVVDRELERGVRTGHALGAALERAGAVSERQLEQAAREQRSLRLSNSFALAEGELLFVENARSGELDRLLEPAADFALLVQATESGVPDADVESLLASLANDALVATASFAALCEDLALAPEERLIVHRAGRGKPIRELVADLGPAALGRARRAVFLALVVGAIGRKRAR